MKLFFGSICVTFALILSAPAAFAQDTDLNRGPLNIFPRSTLQCGKGWRFPILIWGDRPVSVCMHRGLGRNRFGGSF